MTKNKDSKYDLEERTARFGEATIKFCKKIPRSPITDPLIIQLIKAATSIGANYSEADDAESKQDFKHKIGICKKESRESKHFLRMVAVAAPELKEEARVLWQEAKELNLIFNSIYIKVK
ncbi:MAG: four helix bundle protein [Patescibacteria group bacterium]